MTERYHVSYEREMWGWTPKVYDRETRHLVLYSMRPSFTREAARKRVSRAIARYERGESFVEYMA